MRTGRFRRWRWIAGAAQALVALGLPFVSIGGESALRLDVPAGKLHAFGASFAIDEAFVVLAATLLATAGFLLVTLVLGRVWCGWACPQTVLGDLTSWVVPGPFDRVHPERRAREARPESKGSGPTGWKRRWRRPLGFLAVAAVSAIVAADLVWYFVPPAEFFRRLAAGTLGPWAAGSWTVLFAVLFLDLAFLRATFCATACPYAKLQGVLFDRSTLVVAYDVRRDDDCVDCGACVRVCPTGIDIRDGLQMECIACAECIDACRPIMLKLKRPTELVGYFYGEPGRPRRLLRPAVLALAAATLLSFGLTAAAARAASRDTLDLAVVPASSFPPRLSPDGRALDAYDVSMENRARGTVTVRLSLDAPGVETALRPDAVTLGPGEHKRVRLVVAARGAPGRSTATLSAAAAGEGTRPVTRTSPLLLVIPEPP
jgi:cytochrome c oxidase accessory protein FixG